MNVENGGGKDRKGGISMKKGRILVVGLIALLMACGLVLAGCDTGDDGGGGNNSGNTGGNTGGNSGGNTGGNAWSDWKTVQGTLQTNGSYRAMFYGWNITTTVEVNLEYGTPSVLSVADGMQYPVSSSNQTIRYRVRPSTTSCSTTQGGGVMLSN